MKHNNSNVSDVNRREFLRGGSFATLMMLMGGVEIKAQEAAAKPADGATNYKTTADPVKCAVIGCGLWGREILKSLTRLPNAPVVAVCDTYPAMLKRVAETVPNAEKVDDYKKVLANKDIEAVIVATPSHKHRDIVIEALKAGKHVYCEAPIAHTVEDAKAIAQAAKDNPKSCFQPGLLLRNDASHGHLLEFIRTGAMGKTLMAKAQWHKKQSWRQASPNPDREKEINWRLSKETSPGLIGEIGIHQLDMASWYLLERPLAVTGFGSILSWKDGRDVADTVQVVIEYPDDINMVYDITIGNSFEASYEAFYGTDSAIMVRDTKAWMFKEVDAPLLGWEVYARKDSFYNETGIALGADSTKQKAHGATGQEAAAPPPIMVALQAFIENANAHRSGASDFTDAFGADADVKAAAEYMAEVRKNLGAQFKTQKLPPLPTYKEALEATVVALKANEAVVKKQKIQFQKEWFELA